MADLREQLSQALNDVSNSEAQTPTSGAGVDAPVAPEQTDAASDPSKPGRTAGRARDDQGRLLPGKAQKDSAQEPGKPATPTSTSEQSPAVAPVADTRPKPARPSTWRKDHWEGFDKLAETNPALAEYINQRESEFAKGVSTYKSEADKAKGYIEAIGPFLPDLQRFGIDPIHHVGSLLNAHKTLALGSPEQRLSMFVKLANDYKVPLQSMFVQGQDGQVYFNPQLQQQNSQQAHQTVSPQQIEQQIEQRFLMRDAQQQVSQLTTEKYPHLEQVRETMAQLLESKLANDLDSAYQAALRLPQHSEIWDATQRQQRETDQQRQAEEKRKLAEKARANAVSPRSQPTTGASATAKPTGLRAALESSFDEHASRV